MRRAGDDETPARGFSQFQSMRRERLDHTREGIGSEQGRRNLEVLRHKVRAVEHVDAGRAEFAQQMRHGEVARRARLRRGCEP